MAMDLMAPNPMVHPIAIVANEDHYWCNLNGSIGAISVRCVFHNRQLKPMASMTLLASMASLATLVIHWCEWRFIGFIDAIGVNGPNGSIGDLLASIGTNDSRGAIDFNVK